MRNDVTTLLNYLYVPSCVELLKECRIEKQTAAAPRSIRYDKMMIQKPSASDGMDSFVKIMDKESAILKDNAERIKRALNMERFILSLDLSPNQLDFIFMKYRNRKSLRQIADAMHITQRQVYRIYDSVIDTVGTFVGTFYEKYTNTDTTKTCEKPIK